MAEQKKGIIERGANFFEKLHYGLGAVAVGAALIAPPELAGPLIIFGVYEFTHGALWNWLKNRSSKSSKLKPAT